MKKLALLLLVTLSIALSSAACSTKGNSEGLENTKNHMMPTNKILINVNGHQLTATLEHNTSAQALVRLLGDGPLTIQAQEYGGVEKVGPLSLSLPRNDKQITAIAGDIILYQGDNICFYYGRNSWSFTRLGRIDNATNLDLKEIFSTGNATFVLSLPKTADRKD